MKMNENNTINRDKLRNIFLMHQDQLETNNPEFAKSIRSLLGFTQNKQKKNTQTRSKQLRTRPHDIDKEFAKDVSQKFFKTFTKQNDIITQNMKQCTRHVPNPKQNLTTNTTKLQKKHIPRKHQTQILKPALQTNSDIKIPNKYFCNDCGMHHYEEERECEHCGVVHKHCCEVY